MLESHVTQLTCLGGASGIEGFLIACDSGQVLQAFINNPFPILLWEHPAKESVRVADLSGHKRTLAVVDCHARLTVVNLETGQVRAAGLSKHQHALWME